MRRMIAFFLLANLFSVGYGSLFGYGLYPSLHPQHSAGILLEPLREEAPLWRLQERARGLGRRANLRAVFFLVGRENSGTFGNLRHRMGENWREREGEES